MSRWIVGILGILILFLAAMNVRLSGRVRMLEEELATRPTTSSSRLPVSVPEAPQPPSPAAAFAPAAPAPAARAPAPPTAAEHPSRAWNLLDPKDPRMEAVQREEAPLVAGHLQQLTLTMGESPTRGPFTLVPQAAAPDPEATAGPRPGFLGIQGEDVPGGGVKINSVIANSVAMSSGLQPDDIIVEVNGDRVDSLAALSSKISGAGEGAPASLHIRRNGVDFYQGVQLGSRSGTR